MGETDRRILVGIDGSPHSVSALGWAVDDAAQTGASIEAVFVWQVPTLAYSAPGYIPLGEAEVSRQGRACLDEALRSLSIPEGVRVTQTAVEGAPAEVLATLAKSDDVSQVVVGAQGHGGVAGLILGSVSHALTHHCSKPLVIVPRPPDQAAPAGPPRPIVVGVDGSPGAAAALAWAVDAARARSVPLEVVMVLPLSEHAAARATGAADDPEAMSALRAYVANVDTSGVDVSTVVEAGPPARVLTERSAHGLMLVVGTRGHGWAREAITGSVSHSCTHRALVPTVVVPHDH